MNHLINILEGTAAAVMGTMVWLTALVKLLSPKIRISPVITRGLTNEREICYRIQIDNLARRSAIDLRFDCAVVYPVRYADGETTRRVAIQKSGEEPIILPGKYHGQDNVYAMRYGTDMLDKIKAYPDSWVRLRVFVRDSVSGVGKVFTREFHNPLGQIIDKVPVQREVAATAEDSSA